VPDQITETPDHGLAVGLGAFESGLAYVVVTPVKTPKIGHTASSGSSSSRQRQATDGKGRQRGKNGRVFEVCLAAIADGETGSPRTQVFNR
jgi:hypothetical protein